MSTYESKGLERYYVRTITRQLGYLWLGFFLIMGLSMTDMALYAGFAEGASTTTAIVTATVATTVAATGAISGKILDQSGKPLTNIQVLALNQSTTKASGENYYYSPPPYGLSIYPPWTPEGLSRLLGQSFRSYGAPYPGTPGVASDTSSLYRALSKADGTFLLSNLPEGRYSLWAYDPQGRGFEPVIFSLNDRGTESKLLSYYPYPPQNILIKVKSGQTAGPFSMTMSMGGKLSGHITDADTGLPIEGAIIQVYAHSETGDVYGVTGLPLITSSDFNGNFTFSGLPEGKTSVNVSEAEGYITNPGQYYPSFEENTYSLLAGKETSGCKLELKRSGMVSGKVTSKADGKPIAGAEISCFMTSSGTGVYYGYYQSTVAISATDGTYRISGLDTGTYVPVILHTPGFQGAYYPNTQDQSKAKEIRVESGKETASIDFQLIPSNTGNGTIRGRIIDKESGLPVAGIQVNLSQVYVSAPYAGYPPYGYPPSGDVIFMKNRAKAAISGSALAGASDAPNSYATTAYATTASATTASAPTAALSSVSGLPAPQLPPDTVVAPTSGMPTFINPSSYAPIPVEPSISLLPSLSEGNYTYIYPVWTDQEGRFEFTGLEYGKYSLDAYDPSGWYMYDHYPEYNSKTGYTRLPYVELSEKQSTSGNIEIPLRRGGRLEGKVLAGSTPLAGMQVTVIRTGKDNNPYSYPMLNYGYGSGSPDTTDTAGEFTICGLEEGEYLLLAQDTAGSQHYATTYCLDTNAQGEKPHVFTVTPGSSATNLVISMKTGASIIGKVMDKSGKPLAGITINASVEWNYAADGSERYEGLYYSYLPTRYAMTADDGTYTVSGLSEGTYTLSTMDSNGEYQGDCCSGIRVTPPTNVSAPDLVLPKSVVISGRITSQDGQPLANIQVSVFPDYSSSSASKSDKDQNGSSSCSGYQTTFGSATTAGDGTYRITGLVAGSYQLDTYDQSGEYLSGQYSAGSALGTVTGAEGEVKTNLDLHLTQGGTIKGTIRDAATGKPISGLTVTAATADEPVLATVDPVSSTGMPVPPSVDALLPPLQTATAMGYDPGYYPGYGSGQIYSSLPSDSQGNYILHGLCAGKYIVYITDTSGKNYMSQYHAGVSSADKATSLKINTAQTIENIDFNLATGLILKGTVKDVATGQPIATPAGSGLIILTNEQGQGVKQAYTGSSGEYKFTGLCPGTYFVQASRCTDHYPGSYRQTTADQQSSSLITISLPGPVEGIDIFLQPMSSISGKVVDEFDQKPLANITVMATPAFQGSTGLSSEFPGSVTGLSSSYLDTYSPIIPYSPSPYSWYCQSATTDANGLYTLKGLSEGDYVIMASDYSHIYASEYYKNVPVNQPDKANAIHVGRSENKPGINLAIQVGETYTGADTSSSVTYYPTAPYAYAYSGSAYGAYSPVAGLTAVAGNRQANSYNTLPYAQSGVGGQPPTVSTQLPAEAPGNIPAPEIISANSVKKITAGRTFTYQVKVNESAANTSLKYSLNYAPEGMNIDSDSGLVKWQPSNNDAGQSIVQLKVDNGSGQVALQAFRLGVEADTKPPEEVTALTAAKGDQKVTISWKPCANNDEDLADQILYVKKGNAPYGSGISLGKATARYSVENLENGQAYTFKITTRDELGNESRGVTAAATPAKEQAVDVRTPLTSLLNYVSPISNASTLGLINWGALSAP